MQVPCSEVPGNICPQAHRLVTGPGSPRFPVFGSGSSFLCGAWKAGRAGLFSSPQGRQLPLGPIARLLHVVHVGGADGAVARLVGAAALLLGYVRVMYYPLSVPESGAGTLRGCALLGYLGREPPR